MSIKSSTLRSLFLSLFAALLLFPATALGQVSVGADLMSRYVWRGFDFGDSFSVQPDLSYSKGPFSIGTWASYSISANGAGANEHDLYAGLSFDNFSIGVTDYYFPAGAPGFISLLNEDVTTSSPDFFDGDSHTIEPNASVTLPGSVPLGLYGAVNVTNDDDYSTYLEASLPFTVQDVNMSVAVGGIPMASAYYGTTDPGVTKASISASKALPITDSFSLPLSASYILNPYTERSFLVFGVSLFP